MKHRHTSTPLQDADLIIRRGPVESDGLLIAHGYECIQGLLTEITRLTAELNTARQDAEESRNASVMW